MSDLFPNEEDASSSSQPRDVSSNVPIQDRSNSSDNGPVSVSDPLDSSLINVSTIEERRSKDNGKHALTERDIEFWEVICKEFIARNGNNSDKKPTSTQENTCSPTILPDTNISHGPSSIIAGEIKPGSCVNPSNNTDPSFLNPVDGQQLGSPPSNDFKLHLEAEAEKNTCYGSHSTVSPSHSQSNHPEVIELMKRLTRDHFEFDGRVKTIEAATKLEATKNAMINSLYNGICEKLQYLNGETAKPNKSVFNAAPLDMVEDAIARLDKVESEAATKSQIDELRSEIKALQKQAQDSELKNNAEGTIVSATKAKKAKVADKERERRLRAAEDRLRDLRSDVDELMEGLEDLESEWYDAECEIFRMLTQCDEGCRHCPGCGLSGLGHA
ncbi:hypothetical protein F5B19DRAFT_300482 [Rostrohypoxylon terebratum]|nr:hypothetical protein F5B19DRAFT_300482 [Rostrohypoxylon terebratum]